MNIPPPDPDAHNDGRLMHDLSALNTHISQYVLRHLDADAARREPTSVTQEQRLADEMAALAKRVEERANRRETTVNGETVNDRTTQPDVA